MIKNKVQLELTKQSLELFNEALSDLESKKKDTPKLQYRVYRDAYNATITELEEEILEYENSSKKLKRKGLYNRYNITKTNGQEVDENAEYFVLRLDDGGKDPIHIEACREAIRRYAYKIRNHLPQLSIDLFEKYGKEQRGD